VKENVNHPNHYLKESGHEVIDVIRAWKLNFELGNAIKYIARAGKKDPDKEIEDLEKCIKYITMQLMFLNPEYKYELTKSNKQNIKN
jgi:hypothetical protein